MRSRRVATLLLTGIASISRLATAQSGQEPRFRPYWAENGEVRFLRAVSDSTVLSLDVRFAPYHTLVSQYVSYSLYALRCNGTANDKNAVALIGSGNNESQALQLGIAARYDFVRVGLDEPLPALATEGCGELYQRRHGRTASNSRPLPPRTSKSKEDGPPTYGAFRDFWTQDGEARFLRGVTDSSVLVLTVRFAPSRWETDLSATFTQFALRCWQGGRNEIMSIGSGDTEAKALVQSVGHYEPVHAVPDSLIDWPGAVAMLGCAELQRHH